MKLFHILAIVFCLGIFLVPKDSFYTQSMQDTCCKAESKKSDCCKNHSSKKDGKDDSKQSSCNDDCCSSCVVCYTFIETPFSKNLRLELSYYKTNKNPQFQYSAPHLSDRLKEIWQPPKIG
ncbi:hypothetical protein BBI01_15630 [Chryseobacterium artocarpi]|uniref:Uncharacterized protein n=1 Tax=Chryseobacterium artocarpi TaxID=1414727 RepID=A0A1B8ZD57_9FLAO|nr:hypothetical protein [Chryseobacterium artocarpi]OCA69562.1 hypothetical protein BBI01_15630 [Chryseobacterium artocarpi]